MDVLPFLVFMNKIDLETWVKNKYPITVVADRYGGLYTEGEWLAFPLRPEDVPRQSNGSDIAQLDFLESYHEPYGIGPTPDVAVNQLTQSILGALGKESE